MDFDEMIKSEDTDSLYDRWEDYRKELTDYIVSSVEEFNIKKKLSDLRKRRIYGIYTIEDVVAENGIKPTLAIWGAGGCNDMDIVRLSRYFRLVLVDNNINKIKAARSRFGLSCEECLCVDLHFWDVTRDDYKMFEALLRDGAEASELAGFMRELSDRMVKPDYSGLPHFDYSVAVGLASQLNSRFAAMLHMYNAGAVHGRYDRYTDADTALLCDMIYELNVAAVDRMLEAVKEMTVKGVILGYETDNYDTCADMRLQLESLNEEYEVPVASGVRAFNPYHTCIKISGNAELEEGIRNRVEKTGDFVVINHRIMLWPFSEQKSYLMIFRALERSN